MIVTSVVGPNSSPFSAATISDGRSVGDRSNVPNAIVPSRPAVMIAYWKAIWLLIRPVGEQLLPDRRLGRALRDRHGHPPMLVGCGLVGDEIRAIPLDEVLDDAVLDRAGIRLDPLHHPRREDRVEPEDDEDAEERDRAEDPHQQEERLDPALSAHRSLAPLAQLANAGVAALLVLSAHSVSSGRSGSERCPAGGRRASRYCCRITRAAAESSSPLPRSACRPPVDRSSAACHELSRSSS